VKIQDAFPVVAFNRKDLGENRLQAQVLPPGGGHVGLKKIPVRIGLQFDQVGRSDDFFDFAEVNPFSYSRWHLGL
jgi:hypothetical protein